MQCVGCFQDSMASAAVSADAAATSISRQHQQNQSLLDTIPVSLPASKSWWKSAANGILLWQGLRRVTLQTIQQF